MDKSVIILRGCPGSGKSTVAELLVFGITTSAICTADDYFMVDGEYKFDSTKLGEAHSACKSKCEKAMTLGVERIVVANTNTTEKEITPYQILAEQYGYMVFTLIIENRHGGKNEHGVPDESIDRMEERLKNSIKLR